MGTPRLVIADLSSGAGADTTASAIHAVILYIASNPKVYFKLRAEIDATSENGEISEPVKYQEALKLPYLQAGTRHLSDHKHES